MGTLHAQAQIVLAVLIRSGVTKCVVVTLSKVEERVAPRRGRTESKCCLSLVLTREWHRERGIREMRMTAEDVFVGPHWIDTERGNDDDDDDGDDNGPLGSEREGRRREDLVSTRFII